MPPDKPDKPDKPKTNKNTNLAKALIEFQRNVPSIPRSRTVHVQTRGGGSYTFSYATADQIADKIRQPLADAGLAYSQVLGSNETGMPILTTILMHVSGEWLEGSVPIPVRPEQTPQEFGSMITYLRRYSLSAILGLSTEEDDDAGHAAGNITTDAHIEAQETGSPYPRPDQKPATAKQQGFLRGLIERLHERGWITPQQIASTAGVKLGDDATLEDLSPVTDRLTVVQAKELIDRLLRYEANRKSQEESQDAQGTLT